MEVIGFSPGQPLCRAREVLAEAVETPPDLRQALLDTACGGDDGLRREVAGLLGAYDAAIDLLLGAGDDACDDGIHPSRLDPAAAGPAATAGDRVGPYRLVRLIGQGGFGTVYLAEQTHPVRRSVAVKVIKRGMDTEQVVARFEAERQAMAMMDHPNIARVFDAGTTPAGTPYFAMELVEAGVPATEFCDGAGLGLRRRLELFVTVCRAVQHAHQKGVIHRDLKPSNILVTVVDGTPVPKVIDFGIAKATLGRLTDRTLLTEHRQLVGTPEYMSPEQAGLHAWSSPGRDVDTRSDVYALGVLLYEILTGTTPFGGANLRAAGYEEGRRIVREVEPTRPSARVLASDGAAAIAARRGTQPKKLVQALRRDLDWVVLKCLEKDRARRYDSAGALADDVERYLAGEAVSARAPSAPYRLRKAVARHKAWITGGAAVAAALVAGLGAATYGLVAARAQRDVARVETAKAESVNRFLQRMLSAANPDRPGGREFSVRQVLDEASRQLDAESAEGGSLRGQPEVEASARLTLGRTYVSLGLPVPAERQLRRALELRRGAGPPGDSAEVAEMLFHAGTALQLKRDAAGAADFYRRSIAMFRAAGAEDHPSFNPCLIDYGIVLGWLNEGDASEAVLRDALERCRRERPTGGADVAKCLHCLAGALWKRGEHDAAEDHFRRAVAMYGQALGPDHRQTAMAVHDLGAFLMWARHDLAAAEPLLVRAFDAGIHALGPDHAHTNRFRGKLSWLRRYQGNLAEADRLWRDYCLIELRRAALDLAEDPRCAALLIPPAGPRGPERPTDFQRVLADTPDDPAILATRGHVFTLLGRLDDAAADFDRVIALSPNDADAMAARTFLYERAARFDQALPLISRAIELNPSNHWWWCHQAALHLLRGDEPGYRASRAAMLARFAGTTDRMVAENLCRVSLLAPGAWPSAGSPAETGRPPGAGAAETPTPLLPMRVVEENLGGPHPPDFLAWLWMTKGMSEYRAGRFEAAAGWQARSRDAQLVPAAAATAELFLAMAHHRLGRHERARNELAKATDRFRRDAPQPEGGDLTVAVLDWIVFTIVHREAEQVLGAGATGPASRTVLGSD